MRTKLLLGPITSYGVGNMHDKFQFCTVDVQAATLIAAALEQTLDYVHMPNVCHDAQHDVSAMDEGFQTGIVNVYAHTLNLNIQYLTLLWVYKGAAWTSTRHTVLALCTTSFKVVQLLYRPLH